MRLQIVVGPSEEISQASLTVTVSRAVGVDGTGSWISNAGAAVLVFMFIISQRAPSRLGANSSIQAQQ
jgi:hypothetical protein